MDISSDDPLQTFKSLGSDGDDNPLYPYGPLEAIEALDDWSASSSGDEGSRTPDDVAGDPWSAKHILEPIIQQIQVESWGRFHNKSCKESCNSYKCESGPRVFDAGLIYGQTDGFSEIPDNQPAPALQPDAVLSCLTQLLLGRESRLFQYDEEEKIFKSATKTARVPGYTLEDFRSLTCAFISYGSRVRQAKEFATSLNGLRKATSSFVALASGIGTILSALEAHLSMPSASAQTISRLQALQEPSAILLDLVAEIVEKVEKPKNDEELLSLLFKFIQDVEHSAPQLLPIMNQLLAQASRPWLESLESSLGLRVGDAMNTTILMCNEEGSRKRYLEPAAHAGGTDEPIRNMPTFIDSEFAKALDETEQSLELLRIYESGHPLVRLQSSFQPPPLQWQFSWQDVEKIQAKAQEYEANLLTVLEQYNTSGISKLQTRNNPERVLVPLDKVIDIEPFSTESIYQIDLPLPSPLRPPASSLSTISIQALNSTAPTSQIPNSPATSLLTTLCFQPILAAQSRLLSHSILRLFFHAHHLRTHLRLLYSYPLFANGSFLVHLSHALFEPFFSSAAYQKGHSSLGTTGIQFGARETAWPPASSELRIALMSILTESHSSDKGFRKKDDANDGLPGDLSFTIRSDMSDVELEKCMNKDGLEALDFLKIHYKPPKPLDVVITEAVLEKYSRVSKLLLRGARVCFIVKEMMRHERESRMKRRRRGLMERFKVEVNHFVGTVFSYFGTSIEEWWAAFENRLDGIEESLDCYEVGKQVEGMHRLQGLHEEVLDQILAACLLRKRQESVMGLLEEIWGLVLEFAKEVRDGYASDEEGKGRVEGLYEAFRDKVRLFIIGLRGLQDQESVAGRKDLFDGGKMEDCGNGIGRLLLGLEMNGWYMR